MTLEQGSYRGFSVTNHLKLSELQSTLTELVHQETGAEIVHIANDDSENLFSLSFQTIPTSSNGVAHILEHTVLCGSKKFPVKDPFFAMTRRSLNTYMNALTGQDFTCYPASTEIEKDFYHLLEVYLDAVFHPQLKLLSFRQEGHRLSFAKPGDPNSPLLIQGVVYNEMKGAWTGSDARLWSYLFKTLTPDLPYAYDSGGDPKEIPQLSYEELLEFHRVFYHPSRCLFFFYGNLPIEKHLDFLLKHALKGVRKEPFLPPLPSQPRFSSPRHLTERYPIATGEDPTKKTIIALGILTTSISNQEETLALSLIDSLLTDTDASPLKFALLKSGLCSHVESSLNLEMSEVPWVLICRGCEPQNGPKIVEVVYTTLKNLSSKGFDAKEIEASLHQLEFDRTEIGGEGIPFGLHLFFRTVLAKQHGADAAHSLLIHSLFSALRQRLSNPSYLPSLLERYFLNNPHSVLLTLNPDPTLEQIETEEERKNLEQIQNSLSKQKVKEIIAQQEELALYQKQIEHQSIHCLPKVSLRDIAPHAKDYPLTESHQGDLHLFHHNCFTNQILYADLGFDLPAIPFEDLPNLSLMVRCITELGCGGKTYMETLEWQQATLGELAASLSLHVQQKDPNEYKPSFAFRAKALQRNTKALMDLLRDFSLTANFLDPPRIQELLDQHVTALQTRLPKQAMSYAVQLAVSGFSSPAAIQQEWQGLSYLLSVLQWAKRKDPHELCKELNRLYQKVLGTPHPFLVLSCNQANRHQLDPLLPSFVSDLPKRSQTIPWPQTPLTKVPSQGRIIASPVAFNVLAFQVECNSAALLVATDLLKHLVLHPLIREQGGAYGGGATYTPLVGNFYFYSYRDPHLARTYESFLRSIDHIAAGSFNEEELEEAKLAILQDLDAPVPPGQRAITAYHWLRSGRTFQERDAFRREIIQTSKQEISSALQRSLQGKQGVFVSFAGKELFQKEAQKLPFLETITELNF